LADISIDPVVIAGGGPVGLALAGLLARRGIGCTLIARAEPPAAFRPIALSQPSFELIRSLARLEPDTATPIVAVHVSQRHAGGQTVMQAAEHGLPALGQVIDLADLNAALATGVGHSGAHRQTGSVDRWHPGPASIAIDWTDEAGRSHTLESRLLVLADGGIGPLEPVRERPGEQTLAITCPVRSREGHAGRAFERFTAEGPLALLPHQDGLALVWTLPAERAQALMQLEPDAFDAALNAAFGDDLGPLTVAGERQCQPIAPRRGGDAGPRTLRIGNAAQTLHPVAGQGLNLGLRDALALALAIAADAAADPGATAFVSTWQRERWLDRTVTVGLTDLLAGLFRTDQGLSGRAGPPVPGWLRGLALDVLQACPPARRFLARRMMFGARAIP
jgi:2-octaprenyl-6-methoxyphenol hydroxylase